MKRTGAAYKPDRVLMPIGGHCTMNPAAAAAAVGMIKPKYALPIHYGTFPVLRGTPAEFSAALGPDSGKMLVVNPGEKVEF